VCIGSAGLTLSHYDAKAHLVVARRVFDSLTPSWEQIGAVWLPLPHVLNALPVQIDWMYRTGASAIAIFDPVVRDHRGCRSRRWCDRSGGSRTWRDPG
jgi:hypothetical protein